MKKLSRFEKFGMMAAVVVACNFFYMKYMYDPQQARLTRTVKKLNKVIKEVNSLEAAPSVHAIKGRLKKQKAELADLEEQLKSAAVKTGAPEEITELISRINDRLVARHMTLVHLHPDGRVEDGLFGWNAYRLELAGEFYDYIRLLEDLKFMPDAVKLKEITLDVAGGGQLLIGMRILL